MGLSQQQFSDRLGVTLRTVAHYENDRPPTDLKILMKLYTMCLEHKHFGLADFFDKHLQVDGRERAQSNVIYAWAEAWDAYHKLRLGKSIDMDGVLERIMFFCRKANPELDWFIEEMNSRTDEENAAFFASVFDKAGYKRPK